MNARLSSLLVAGGVVLAATPSGSLALAAAAENGASLQEVVLDQANGTVINLLVPGLATQPSLQVLDKPHRIVLDLASVDLGVHLSKKELAALCRGPIQKARMAKHGDGTRVVFEVGKGTQVQVAVTATGLTMAFESGNGPVVACMAPNQSVVPTASTMESAPSPATPVADATPTTLSAMPSVGMPYQVISNFAVSTLLPTVPKAQEQPAEESPVPPGASPVVEPPMEPSTPVPVPPRAAVPEPPPAPTAVHAPVIAPVAAPVVAPTPSAPPAPHALGTGERSRTLGDSQTRYTGSRMSFDVKSMEITDFLRIVAEHAGLNLIADTDVQGTYSFMFKNVPWDQVLEMTLKHVGLGKEISNGVIRVAKIEKLQKEEEDRKRLEDARSLAGELQTISRPLSFAKVGEARGIIEKMLTKRGSLITDDRTNTLIISDLPRNMALIDDLIAQLDVQIQQVQIEARVVEANKNFQKAFGVLFPSGPEGAAKQPTDAPWSSFGGGPSWNGGSPTKRDSNPTLGTAWTTNTGINGPTGTLWVSFLSNRFSINTILQAMEKEGKGKVISSPKLVTQNNKKAKVLSGRKVPYPSMQSGANSGAISIAFADANLELDVTPQITNDGTIIMDIKLEKAEADFSNPVQGTPTITRKALETQVLVKDGGTAILGGVYATKASNATSGVPFLSKLPVLGWLFRNNDDQEDTQEMLVFITPRVVKM